MLGKRAAPVETNELKAIEQAVVNQVKRRRTISIDVEAPVTIKERRALDKYNISKLIREHRELLQPWSDIMVNLLKRKRPQHFVKL